MAAMETPAHYRVTRPESAPTGQPAGRPSVACRLLDLVAHRAATEPDAAASAPEWVQLIPGGEFAGRDGRGPYRIADPAALVAAFAALGMPAAIDYEHQSDLWDGLPGPTPAAGWIVAVEHRGDDADGGLWGRVEWTERGAALIASREYRYLSPVFYHHAESGEVLALVGAGLTNQPNLHLRALSRALHRYHYLEPAMPADTDLAERVRYMLELPVTATPAELVEHLQRLIARLGAADSVAAEMRRALDLPDDADPVALIAAVQSQATELCAHGTAVEVLAEHTGAARTEDGALLPAEVVQHAISRLADADAELAQMREQTAQRDAEQLVAELMRERRLTPAEADAWGRDLAREHPERLRAVCSTREPILPAGQSHQSGAAAGTADPPEDDTEYLRLVRAHQTEHGTTRGQAMMRVARSHPDAHAEWLEHCRTAGRAA